ncbi:multidrug export protein EmrA [Burkholderia sp. WAC0059]|uniref:HlyD family secretion protein n=1 Tax=Burkholderia sp. WAC0059 TaxID=2066022 RepID=UPI000C7F5457|nr:HlyD family secretion protein [Burkholderia sp. WAC0059]PLZ03996.1 multidrug export protein EmrA [Burkholderia sp. WAC0059]
MVEQANNGAIGAWGRRHHGKPPRSVQRRHPRPGRDGGENGNDGDGPQQANASKGPGKKPLIILAVVLVLIAIAAFVWWFATRNEVDTDDAYTDGNAITIAPKVSGYVTRLAIDDNVYVHKGQLMVEIDHRDYQAQVDQARAQLGLAHAELDAAQAQLDVARVQYPAQYEQARAQIETATATFARAEADYARQHNVDARATTQQNIDTATAQARTAHANVLSAQAQLRTARLVPQQIRQAVALVEQRREQVAQAEAQLTTALLNLGWCDLRAPSDGWVTRRNVQYGSFLQAGTALFSIVTPQVWITANFKESQLTRMRAGDKVEISVDAWPKFTLHGHVDSIQLGSGSRFSAFPAENATGNFVKIVQRVPVKIMIDGGLPHGWPLPLGLSVEPTVYLTH